MVTAVAAIPPDKRNLRLERFFFFILLII